MSGENVILDNLDKPEGRAVLKDYLMRLGEDADIIYTESAPNGVLSARRGKIAIYKNGTAYEQWQNMDGGTTWQRTDFSGTFLALTDTPSVYSGAGSYKVKVKADESGLEFIADSVSTDEKVKSDSGDSTADYLDGKVDNDTIKVNTTSHKIYAQHSLQLFTSSGTFTAPVGVTKIYLTCAAGGGGGSGASATKGGCGGGAGQSIINVPYTVVPGNSYTVTIGAGGAGGAYENDGVDGGDTVFDSLSLTKGTKGLYGGGTPAGGTGGGVANLNGFAASGAGGVGGGIGIKGGDGGANAATYGSGGGGTLFSKGGAGGTAGDGVAGSLGSGGGGASQSGAVSGGQGGNGFILIEW